MGIAAVVAWASGVLRGATIARAAFLLFLLLPLLLLPSLGPFGSGTGCARAFVRG